MESTFEWFFSVKGNLLGREDTEITVYSDTYRGAVRKIRNLQLPEVEKISDVEEFMVLIAVSEVDAFGKTDEETKQETE